MKKKKKLTENEKVLPIEYVSPHNKDMQHVFAKEKSDQEYSFCPISNKMDEYKNEQSYSREPNTSLSGVAAITAAAECFKTFPMPLNKSSSHNTSPSSNEKRNFNENGNVMNLKDKDTSSIVIKNDKNNIDILNCDLFVDKDVSSMKSTVCNCRKSRCLKM
jgi:hypothetical protein